MPSNDPDSSAPKSTSGPSKPVPAVVSLSREERQSRERWRSLKRSWPSVLIALVVHGILLWQMWLWYPDVEEFFADLRIEAHLDDTSQTEFVDDTPEEEPLEELDEVIDPVVTEYVAEASSEVDSQLEDVLGLGSSGTGGVGVRGRRGGDALDRFEGVTGGTGGSSGFSEFIRDVRDRGLDVVFVIDATASMGKFLSQARSVVDDIIDDLSEVIPTQRIGMVAYRDETDAWLTRHEDLTADRYRVQNFLLDIEPIGGGDFEEAVDVGLTVAFSELSWRPGSQRVVIVVGDAPAHPEDEQGMLASVRTFLRQSESSLSVLYTGTDPNVRQTDRDRRAVKSLARLAQTGGGFMAELAEDADVLRDNILKMSFGRKWFDDVQRLLSMREIDNRQKILRKKIDRRDRPWLIRQFKRNPVPSIVKACMEVFDRSIAESVFATLLDPKAPSLQRHASLHVIKRALDADAFIDIERPIAEQQGMVNSIQRKIDKLPPAGVERRSARPPSPPQIGVGGG